MQSKLQVLLKRVRATDIYRPLKRFSVPTVLIVIITLLALTLIWSSENMSESNMEFISKFIFSAICSTLVVYGVQMLSERKQFSPPVQVIAIASSLLITFGFSFLVINPVTGGQLTTVSGFSIMVYLFMVVAFPFSISFIDSNDDYSYWKFNVELSRRSGLIFIFLSVLFAGLMAAIVALAAVFEARVDERLYVTLMVVAYLFLFPYVTLLATPINYAYEYSKSGFPKITIRFSQFVLIPLISIYIFILYLYIVKSFATSDIPSNHFVRLSLVFFIPGYLVITSLAPLWQDEKYRWVVRISKYLTAAVLPLIAAYFYGISVRVGEYGLSIPRAYIIILGLYILGFAVYVLLAKKLKLNWLLFALPLMLFIATFFPVFNLKMVSESSMYHKLADSLIEVNAIDSDWNITGQEVELNYLGYQNIYDDFRYIANNYGFNGLSRFNGDDSFDKQISSIMEDDYPSGQTSNVLEAFNISQNPNDSRNSYQYGSDYRTIWTRKSPQESIDVKGFDIYQEFIVRQAIPGFNGHLRIDRQSNTVIYLESRKGEVIAEVDLTELINNAVVGNYDSYIDLDQDQATFEFDGSRIVFTNIGIQRSSSEQEFELFNAEGYILITNDLLESIETVPSYPPDYYLDSR